MNTQQIIRVRRSTWDGSVSLRYYLISGFHPAHPTTCIETLIKHAIQGRVFPVSGFLEENLRSEPWSFIHLWPCITFPKIYFLSHHQIKSSQLFQIIHQECDGGGQDYARLSSKVLPHRRSLDWHQNLTLLNLCENLFQICSTADSKVKITPLVGSSHGSDPAAAVDLYLTKGRIPQWRVTLAWLPLKRGIDSTLKGKPIPSAGGILSADKTFSWGRG